MQDDTSRSVQRPDDRLAEDRDWERAGRLLALGHHHRAFLRPPFAGEDVYPRFVERAEGCTVVDSAGRTFLDWMMGWGPVLLGYRHPKVEAAIRAQLEAGPTVSLLHRVSLDVASMLTEMIPCAEMVEFGKNGSDVTTAAVRIARAWTGREILFYSGFHGFHDWFAAGFSNVQGVPKATAPLLQQFPYNDLPALEALFDRFPGAVAAVVMEPTSARLPEPGYLEGVRDLAHRHGALLVFDEMITGFRLANGGAQEYFGVTPDLAAFGKAIANGMPLSAIVGRRRYMRILPHVSWGMTFMSETLSLAAARAVLEVLRTEPVVEHIARAGRRIRESFHRACAKEDVRAALVGADARLSFEFETQGGFEARELLTLFLRECARRGMLSHGLMLPSYAHDDDALVRTESVLADALSAIVGAIRGRSRGDVPALAPLYAAKGYVDTFADDGTSLRVDGWMLVDNEPPDAIECVAPSGESQLVDRALRPDVAAAFPLACGAEHCGFAVLLPAMRFARDGIWDFELRASRRGRVVFRCPVSRPMGPRPSTPGPFELSQGSVFG